jgi:GNAT superfamily N-acetyltransferase
MLFSGLPIPFFNVGVVTGEVASETELGSLARDACGWAANKAVPWFLLVTDGALAGKVDAAATLKEYQLTPAMKLTGMLAEDVAPLAKAPEGLDLRVAHDDESSAEVLRVNEAAYGMGMQAAIEHFGSYAFWKDHFAVVGRIGGKPVSSSSVMMVDGYRYVAFVATHPEYQRRGYADAAMRRSLDAAAEVHGRTPTILHATEAGRPVYARMGYTPISTHTFFLAGAH